MHWVRAGQTFPLRIVGQTPSKSQRMIPWYKFQSLTKFSLQSNGRSSVQLEPSQSFCFSNCRQHQPGVAIRTLSLFFFLLRQPLSDVWWLPTNRHRLPTNRHRLHTNRHRLPTNRHRLPTNRHRLHTNLHRLPTNRHRLPTNRHRLPTNRHRLPTNRHQLPTNRHQLPTGRHHRAYWTLRVFFSFPYGNPWHQLQIYDRLVRDNRCTVITGMKRKAAHKCASEV